MFYKGVIKIYIVCNKDIRLQNIMQSLGDLVKEWCIGNHRIADAGECGDISWNGLLGIYQRFKMFDHAFAVMHKYGYLRDAMRRRIASCGFDIYYSVQSFVLNRQFTNNLS